MEEIADLNLGQLDATRGAISSLTLASNKHKRIIRPCILPKQRVLSLDFNFLQNVYFFY